MTGDLNGTLETSKYGLPEDSLIQSQKKHGITDAGVYNLSGFDCSSLQPRSSRFRN